MQTCALRQIHQKFAPTIFVIAPPVHVYSSHHCLQGTFSCQHVMNMCWPLMLFLLCFEALLKINILQL